jgi:hypothetical protein
MKAMAPMFKRLLDEDGRSLQEQLGAEAAARSTDSVEEAALPAPRSDGLFAGIQPLQMLD